eukprot:scaffold76964_cov57-Attheya_sp.AAC.1
MRTSTCRSNQNAGDYLGRYTLSVVLSYLSEAEGTAFLITNRLFCRKVLPIFELPPQNNINRTELSKSKTRRHAFATFPVEDPAVLLARLNTRRLRKRIRCIQLCMTREHDTNMNMNMNMRTDMHTTVLPASYKRGLSTEDLATEEWDQQEELSTIRPPVGLPVWPAPLELLRFASMHKPQNQRHRRPPVLLASYPRSGNTLLRTLLESLTSTVTGSDTRPNRTLSQSLVKDYGLMGEGLATIQSTTINDTNHSHFAPSYMDIVKTHFPERKGCLRFSGRSVILLVRNPFDAIDSYWNLCLTNTHSDRVTDTIYDTYKDKFHGLVSNEIKVWCQFHHYYISRCSQDNIPLLLVRYEDLVLNMDQQLTRILSFIHFDNDNQNKNVLSAFWRGRIRHVLGLDEQNDDTNGKHQNPQSNSSGHKHWKAWNTGAYQQPSKASAISMIGKSLRKGRYSDEELKEIHQIAESCYTDATRNIGATNDPENYEGGDNDDCDSGKTKSLLQEFGYDIFDQGFPNNFSSHEDNTDIGSCQFLEKTTDNSNKDAFKKEEFQKSVLKVNTGPEIRTPLDPYGRAMTAWRKDQTENDAMPFPRVKRDHNK